MRILTAEELGTYSCSHSCKFDHSASFLLTRYNHIQNIPILEVRNGRIKEQSNGGGGGETQNIQISISFHSTTHNHENTKHMQTDKLKTVNITDFWNKS